MLSTKQYGELLIICFSLLVVAKEELSALEVNFYFYFFCLSFLFCLRCCMLRQLISNTCLRATCTFFIAVGERKALVTEYATVQTSDIHLSYFQNVGLKAREIYLKGKRAKNSFCHLDRRQNAQKTPHCRFTSVYLNLHHFASSKSCLLWYEAFLIAYRFYSAGSCGFT